ncbi:MAG: hypothetical protein NTY64_19245, partial [Deltaproteobacteria bacterium]|nr:hypothetical protein [Deltaproteobacteria bacterium]
KSPERWFRKKLQMQGAQKLRSEAHLQVRRNDEVAAQRRRWTFYETISEGISESLRSLAMIEFIWLFGHCE